MAEIRKCALCKERVRWIGGYPPTCLDIEPSRDGTIAVIDDCAVQDQVLSETARRMFDGQYYTQHAATCRVLHPPKEKKK